MTNATRPARSVPDSYYVRIDPGHWSNPRVVTAPPEVRWNYLRLIARFGFTEIERGDCTDEEALALAGLARLGLARPSFAPHPRLTILADGYVSAIPAAEYERRALTAKSRAAILERDDYECQVCGSTEDLQVDHVWPVALGGRSEGANLWVLCRPCNAGKRAKPIPEFLASLEEGEAEGRLVVGRRWARVLDVCAGALDLANEWGVA